jgi:NAD(P)H-quinone oxidoreductase subunit 2
MDFRDLILSLNTETIFPEGIIIVSLLLTILIDLISDKRSESFTQKILPWIPVIGFSISLILLVLQWQSITNTETIHFIENKQISFVGSFQGDAISIAFRFFIALAGILCILLSSEYMEKSGTAFIEFLVLFVTATLGGMFLAGTNDLVTLFVSLETLGLSSYLLTGYMKRDLRSNEAALKYLLIGAASSSLLLYGISWLYGISGGHLEFNYLIASLISTDFAQSSSCWLALLFITAGIAFKISAAPFHQWTPDVYQGSPTPVVAFLSVASKAAGLALATRVLAIVFPYLDAEWHFVFEILAVISMLLGNLIAITQTSLKRMLGYSSVGQAGYLLIGLITGYEDGYSSMLVYILIYLFMNLGAFAGVILFGLRTGTDQIKDYGGLASKDPLLALCLSISLLSLGGIPPLAGFFGKIYLFWAGWQSGFYLLIFMGLITSVISIYYYLRVVKIMFIKESQEMSLCVQNYPPIAVSFKPIELGMGFCIFGSLFSGVFLNPIVQVAQSTIYYTPSFQSSITSLQNLTF